MCCGTWSPRPSCRCTRSNGASRWPSFFRDKPTWDYVQEALVPRILEASAPNDPIRVWSTGCSTGEEAYTTAMIFAEVMGEEDFKRRVKIYATDVDGDALSIGRHAIYSHKQLEAVPPELREKYFEQANGSYAFRVDLRRSVIKSLRSTIIEPEHRFFLALLMKYRKALEQNYKLIDRSDSDKRVVKARLFQELKDEYQVLKGNWGGYSGYDRFFEQPLSNAHLASIATYEDFVPAFRALLKKAGSFPRFYQEVRRLAELDRDDRHRVLKKMSAPAPSAPLMVQRSEAVPASPR